MTNKKYEMVNNEVAKLMAKSRWELGRAKKLAEFPRWSPEHDLSIRVAGRAEVFRIQAKMVLNSY